MLTITDFQEIVLGKWNNTYSPYSDSISIHSLLEDKARLYPRNIAIRSSTGSITYEELDQRANRMADIIAEQGVGNKQFIGILMDRSIDMVVSLLAILKTGAAYVPFNTDDPPKRIQQIISQVNLSLVITEDKYKNFFSDQVPCIDIHSLDLQDAPGMSSSRTAVPASNYAYIIFTSGTTCTPKGVLVNHGSVVNLIEWVNNTFSISSDDSLIWTTNLSFDLSVYDIFGILAAGATLRLLDDEERCNPQRQLDIMLKEGITFWDSAPQVLQLIVPYMRDLPEGDSTAALRLVFLSGDWVPLNLPGEISTRFPGAQVVALGGATEATIWSNYFIVDEIKADWKSVPYGKPIQNSRYYILDNDFNHCLPGTPGDLLIGGTCLAEGYYNDEDLTAKKFIDDPYQAGERLYLTGDRAQWMPDGNIEFLGRADNQIKLRGCRIEPGEIESLICEIDEVNDAVVKLQTFGQNDSRLVAFVKCAIPDKLNKARILAFLHERLPMCMIPSEVVILKDFLLTPNGKIDKKALVVKSIGLNTSTQALKVQNKTEKELIKLWQQLLKVEIQNTTDNFFDIGGHSLHAIRLINQIDKLYNCKITYRDFLAEYHTIEKLAKHLNNGTAYEKKAEKIASSQLGKFENIYCLQPNGDGIPVFFIYGECCLLFDEHLFGNNHPTYAFVWPGSDGEDFIYDSVEELANLYCSQIKELRPDGPYCLCGFSLGGLVALEMAMKFQETGFDVPLLALIDSSHPSVLEVNKLHKWKHLAENYGIKKVISDRLFEAGPRFIKKGIQDTLLLLSKTGLFKLSRELRKRKIDLKVAKIYTKYHPGKFQGSMLLFKVKSNAVKEVNLGWNPHLNEIKTIMLNGSHLDAMDDPENKKIISIKLRKYLEDKCL